MYSDEIPIGKAEDLREKKFGKLTPLYRIKNTNKNVKWRCQCDCGNICDVSAGNLKNQHTQSCGCIQKEITSNRTRKDLTGQHFGRLTVIALKEIDVNNKYAIWHCKCECGNEVDIAGYSLTHGRTKSCGCLNKELASQRSLQDLTGKTFGKLTVLYRATEIGDRVKWHCKCSCGNEKDIEAYSLTHGLTQSCGCNIASRGEQIIQQLLEQNHIIYEKEKIFESCYFTDTNRLARFDFFINNSYLIEFDGIQHFKERNSGWGIKNPLNKIQQHDEFKNQWCKNNNIPLIRIPYTHLNELCIEDLLLETSKFII